MSLETYRRKRDFSKTPEPSGEEAAFAPPKPGRRFVVQRHRATRLHYDFRLELDGVLVSWAVPKGPSLNPKDRRMAVRTEDHPLSYFDFEGVIPKGEYGGGDVVVWDWGTWQAEETSDPASALRRGELKFSLDGQKLKGRFTIVKTRPGDPDKDEWLLIHKNDECADPEWDVDAYPRSVKTGRSNDEVAAGADAIWDSRAPAEQASVDLSGAAATPLPEFIEPMKATAVDRAFSDPDWLFEVKLDGYRVEAVIDDGRLRLWTRNRQDAARYFPDLAAGPATWINARSAIVDGEVVALDEEGNPSFALLQERAGPLRGGAAARAGSTPAPIVYYAFDLLHHDGRSLLAVPLEQRKRLLRSLLREHAVVRFGAHIETDGEAFLDVVQQRGLEGMVAKLRNSPYEPGRRSRYWLKVKVRREQEVVVVGYEPGKGTHKQLGSLLVATSDDGRLRFAGEVGSGLDERTRRFFRDELEQHRLDAAPVANPPRLKDARWSAPRHVIRVEYSEWTSEGYLRQPSYKGIEVGRDPNDVAVDREEPARATVAAAERSAKTARGRAAAGKSEGAKSDGAKSKSGPVKSKPKRGGAAQSRAVVFTEPGNARSGPPQAATAEELAALDALVKEGRWRIGGHEVRLTNLDKVFFPEPGFTKRDLVRYYVTVAPVMLPYLRGRAVNLWRWPDGVTGNHFWQKEIPAYAPEWMSRWAYPEAKSSESHTYIVAERVATMAWLANHATIDMHAWTSRTDAYKHPTYALVDIDPGPDTTFDELLALARLYRSALGHLGVTGLPKVSGKRGIQVWIPIRPIYTFDQTRAWVEGISRAVGATLPDLVSWEWEKSSRRGRARLDYTQNAVNKTLVAPYAVRPVPNAAVSTPIEWRELDDPSLRPDGWNIRTILDRLVERGDLFRPVLEIEQELPTLD
ncbi:MAG: DNA ligase D [Chloroflexota bacterium]|nr:DNA ligase D [Chloroflexota bacterium]